MLRVRACHKNEALTTLAFADYDSVHFGWTVMFKIGCNQSDGLSANDVRADIQVEETPIEVIEGKHKKLYNMLLKAFAERVKATIEEQLKVIIAASTPILKAK